MEQEQCFLESPTGTMRSTITGNGRGSIMVVGGWSFASMPSRWRNIGNHYLEVATDANFRDLDIAASGPVVRDVSSVFDHFWNGDRAVPVSALVDRTFNESDLEDSGCLS